MKGGAIKSIPDLARYLELSTWTVSRALNGHPEVNEETTRRILAAVKDLGFRPNPAARALGGGRTGLIGVCSLGWENPILQSKIFYLQEFMRSQQLRAVLEVSLPDPENEARVLEDFARIRVDGVVLLYSLLSAPAAERLLKGQACVMVDPHEEQTLPSVALDRRRAMRLILEHLLRLEHRSFALAGITKADAGRWPGLADTARDHGLDPDVVFRIIERPNLSSAIEEGQVMAETILRWPERERPTAVIAMDDRIALGLTNALRNAGLSVPRHISVTGFDNTDFARKLQPTLTTIEQRPLRMMELAGQLLIEQISHRPKTRLRAPALVVDPELIIGESTGPAWRGER